MRCRSILLLLFIVAYLSLLGCAQDQDETGEVLSRSNLKPDSLVPVDESGYRALTTPIKAQSRYDFIRLLSDSGWAYIDGNTGRMVKRGRVSSVMALSLYENLKDENLENRSEKEFWFDRGTKLSLLQEENSLLSSFSIESYHQGDVLFVTDSGSLPLFELEIPAPSGEILGVVEFVEWLRDDVNELAGPIIILYSGFGTDGNDEGFIKAKDHKFVYNYSSKKILLKDLLIETVYDCPVPFRIFFEECKPENLHEMLKQYYPNKVNEDVRCFRLWWNVDQPSADGRLCSLEKQTVHRTIKAVPHLDAIDGKTTIHEVPIENLTSRDYVTRRNAINGLLANYDTKIGEWSRIEMDERDVELMFSAVKRAVADMDNVSGDPDRRKYNQIINQIQSVGEDLCVYVLSRISDREILCYLIENSSILSRGCDDDGLRNFGTRLAMPIVGWRRGISDYMSLSIAVSEAISMQDLFDVVVEKEIDMKGAKPGHEEEALKEIVSSIIMSKALRMCENNDEKAANIVRTVTIAENLPKSVLAHEIKEIVLSKLKKAE